MNNFITANYANRVIRNTDALGWEKTKDQKITQKIIETAGNDERITSLICYAAGAVSSPHCHPHGEEIFVLEGTLSDERGDFTAGSYIRNPPGSFHQPYSKNGCIIFIKKGYMDRTESEHLHVDSYAENWQANLSSNTDTIGLYNKRDEKVELVRFLPFQHSVSQLFHGDIELYVLDGVLNHQDKFYPKNTWIK